MECGVNINCFLLENLLQYAQHIAERRPATSEYQAGDWKERAVAGYADLEIGLHRWDSTGYAVELRYSRPDSDSDIPPVRGLTQFPLEQLRGAADPAAYGALLTASLFADATVAAMFVKARLSAQTLNVLLRLRLYIGPSAPELHSLHWETLRDPEQPTTWLLINETILFSRWLSSSDWRPVHLRPAGALRALIIIANPSELAAGEYRPGGRLLTPLDVPGELARAQAGLGSIPATALATPGAATLNRLSDQLHEGYDIVYLVCHGALIKGEPQLWLEDDAGHAAVTPGSELVARLSELQDGPRLVVLASCQSAGTGADGTSTDNGVLAALGPRLAEAGVPAVLAMQGNVTMRTMAAFMPVFFREMARDGQLDRALAAARGAVRDQLDAWMPVLFTRLRGGRLWYIPGFTGDRAGFEKWPALLDNIYDGRCTPVLGSGLLEQLIGTTRELASNWADAYHYPMAPYEREDLPQVAQYLAVNQQPAKPRRELANYVRLELLRRFAGQFPPGIVESDVEQVVTAVGAYLRRTLPTEPHKVLAGLPFPIYLTANPDNMLADALTEAGKAPQLELCRWNEEVRWPRSVYERDPDYVPSVEHPLVYHLFGHVALLDSVVLKEDDYFDFLIGVTSNKTGVTSNTRAVPDDVRRALADTALLFLGFNIEDWDFRVLFRSIMSQEGGRRRARYTHVAAQIDPEESRNLDPDGARRYLQGYFQEADISIYWGRVADFVSDLQTRWQAYVQTQGGRR
jgi:hypothetical protein